MLITKKDNLLLYIISNIFEDFGDMHKVNFKECGQIL